MNICGLVSETRIGVGVEASFQMLDDSSRKLGLVFVCSSL